MTPLSLSSVYSLHRLHSSHFSSFLPLSLSLLLRFPLLFSSLLFSSSPLLFSSLVFFSLLLFSSLFSDLDDRLHVLVPVLVLQVVDELGAIDGVLCDFLAQVVERDVGGEQLAGREVTLVVADVAVIVATQAEPGDGVEHEGAGLEHDGDADVQVPVGDVVVEQAGTTGAAHRAPQQTGGVNPDAKDQRRGNETCMGGGIRDKGVRKNERE